MTLEYVYDVLLLRELWGREDLEECLEVIEGICLSISSWMVEAEQGSRGLSISIY